MPIKYIIGTGWWCDNTGIHTHSHLQQQVDVSTRQVGFFELWYKAIMKFTNPQSIIIVDSNSPVKPNIIGKSNVQLISLDKNYGAAMDGTSNQKLSGWDKGVLLGAAYALMCDAEYFVYVEQDCLLYGKGIIEEAISHMGASEILFGDGFGTPQPLQQSFFIVKAKYLHKFISPDYDLIDKSYLAASPEQRYHRYFQDVYSYMPFGHGRVRPIDYSLCHFYAQHLTKEELSIFKRIIK